MAERLHSNLASPLEWLPGLSEAVPTIAQDGENHLEADVAILLQQQVRQSTFEMSAATLIRSFYVLSMPPTWRAWVFCVASRMQESSRPGPGPLSTPNSQSRTPRRGWQLGATVPRGRVAIRQRRLPTLMAPSIIGMGATAICPLQYIMD